MISAYELTCSNKIVGIEKMSGVHQLLPPFFGHSQRGPFLLRKL